MDDNSPPVTASLLEQVKGGDEDAGDRLVEILYPLVSRRVRNHVRRLADQEDVIQEVFLKVFLKIEQYKATSPFEHWVSRIAVTSCYDWLRKKKSRPLFTFSDLSEEEAALVQRTLNGDNREEASQQRQLLVEVLDTLIDRLKPREQIVIRLLDLEGHTVREVGDITGWGASRIKTLAMRARRKLAQQLKTLEQDSTTEPQKKSKR
jgi:RNA polymerase sigma-70 factor (ECF subfamily)